MTRKMIQGQGPLTVRKEQGLSAVFDVNLAITKYTPVLMPRRYFHFDLHCGSGWNEDADCPGSPIVFLERADASGKEFAAFFVDREVESVCELAARDGVSRPNVFCHAGPNADFAPSIPNLIRHFGESPETAIGSVLCDPNGIIDIPFAELHRVFDKCRRLDIIINWNSMAAKRSRRAFPKKYKTLPRVSCFPRVFQKQYWLIRDIAERTLFDPGDRWGWSILIGRNMAGGDYKKKGFHDVRSERGKRIIEQLDWFADGSEEVCPLSNLCRVSTPSCLQGNTGNGDGAAKPTV